MKINAIEINVSVGAKIVTTYEVSSFHDARPEHREKMAMLDAAEPDQTDADGDKWWWFVKGLGGKSVRPRLNWVRYTIDMTNESERTA